MLSDAERRVLTTYCSNHAVASCDECRRDYMFTELGVEIQGRRYYFCPSCRVDFVDDLHLHILGCRGIAAALEERLERSQQLMKESDRLATASAILAAESRALAQRVLDTKQDARHVPATPE